MARLLLQLDRSRPGKACQLKNDAWYPKFIFVWFVVCYCFMIGLLLSGCSEPSSVSPARPDTVAIAAENPTQLDRTFDDLKFDIEPDAPYDAAMLTDELLELDSERVRDTWLHSSERSVAARTVRAGT